VTASNDPETVWNAFRFGNYEVNEGETVRIFLLVKGVQSESLDTEQFQITEQMRSFVEKGGAAAACEISLKIRTQEARGCAQYRPWQICSLSSSRATSRDLLSSS